MNPKRENTPERASRWKYEETHKAERRQKSVNFQTKLPRQEYEELCEYIAEKRLTKADFLRQSLQLMKEYGPLTEQYQNKE